MRERIVEIAENGRFLSCRDGFLLVSEKGSEIGRVPLDDVLGVVATARGITFSRTLVDALASRGASFVLCGHNFAPTAWLVPMVGHHAQGERLRAQAALSVPARKRAWQELVRAKLRWQGAALAAVGAPDAPLLSLCVFHAMPVLDFTVCRSKVSRDAGPGFHGMSVQDFTSSRPGFHGEPSR
jgi:CRISPR-associated protein Cas1